MKSWKIWLERLLLSSLNLLPKARFAFNMKSRLIECVFSHDVMAAIFVSQNNKTAAMFVSQTSPVGVELFSYINAFFCSNKFAQMLATWVKTQNTVKFGKYALGLIFSKPFLRGLFLEGNFRFKIDWANLIVGNLPFLFCFTLYLRATSKYKPPRGPIFGGDM